MFLKIPKKTALLIYCSVRVPSSDNDRLLQANQTTSPDYTKGATSQSGTIHGNFPTAKHSVERVV